MCLKAQVCMCQCHSCSGQSPCLTYPQRCPCTTGTDRDPGVCLSTVSPSPGHLQVCLPLWSHTTEVSASSLLDSTGPCHCVIYLLYAGTELWHEEGGAQRGKAPDSLAPAPWGPWPCLPIFPVLLLCAWPGWWAAGAGRALMYCSAWCHSFWAQQGGTSGAWARSHFRGASGSHPSMALPCLCLVRPGQSPAFGSCWDMFPIRLMESSRASGATAPGD